MADVVVEKLNNIHVRIKCEPSIEYELNDFFTFTTPGAQFSPAYKNGYWDGKTRLFSVKTKQIYVGLVPHVAKFCELNKYSFSYDEPVYTPVDTLNLSKALNLPIEPRDYQLIASSYALTKKRCIVVSPTASGKSLIIYLIVRHLMAYKKRGLLIVPTVSLVEQMYSDFKSYGWDVEKYCEKIYAGRNKITDSFLTISTWQSVFDLPKQYFARYDFVIGDEAHTFKAASLTNIMNKLINCDVRIGTTGTLDDSKVNKLVLEGLFGPSKKIVSAKELMEQGHLASLKIKCLILSYPKHIREAVKKLSYQEEIDFIVKYDDRNEFVKNLVLSLEGNTLVLFTFVEKHGKILHELIEKQSSNRKVFFVYGGTEVEEREAVRHITEKENNAIIVASYGCFSTGINIRNLHNIVFSSPTKSKIRSLQSIGRGLRLGDNKKSATLYDIVDDLRVNSYTNFAIKHFEERVKYYSEEKFDIHTQNYSL